jgi:hypothetical protein
MTREQAVKIIERRSGSYADYAYSCAIVYEDEMKRRHPGWSQCWQDQAQGLVGLRDQTLVVANWCRC